MIQIMKIFKTHVRILFFSRRKLGKRNSRDNKSMNNSSQIVIFKTTTEIKKNSKFCHFTSFL